MRADALLGGFVSEDAKALVPVIAGYTSTFFPKIVLTGTKSRILFFHWVQGSPLPRARGAQPRYDSGDALRFTLHRRFRTFAGMRFSHGCE